MKLLLIILKDNFVQKLVELFVPDHLDLHSRVHNHIEGKRFYVYMYFCFPPLKKTICKKLFCLNSQEFHFDAYVCQIIIFKLCMGNNIHIFKGLK